MPDYRKAARRAALAHGLDPNIFERQINQESGFDPSARSGAGAIGIAQIMPGTAKGWGVDPTDPIASLDAAAKNMGDYVRKYGSYRNALVAYNAGPGRVGGALPAETQNYIKTILGGSDPKRLGTPKQTSGGTAQTPTVDAMQTLAQPFAPFSLPERPQRQVSAPSAPSYSAALALPEGYQAPSGSAATVPSRFDAGTALESLQTLQSATQTPSPTTTTGKGVTTAAPTGRQGRVVVDPNADRPGVKTHRAVLDFASQVAGIAGVPIRIGTGSRHSRLTVDGNVSDHWSGNAADIPATGARLITLGQAALVAAGMSRAQARKQRGGLYNVGGKQIIFNTHEGGDHTTHLHVGLR